MKAQKLLSNRIKTGALLTLAAVFSFRGACAESPSPAKPNVIFILSDDQGYADLGRTGNPVLKTPNLDALGDQSVRFTDFQVAPTCSPTRAALMTGQHSFRLGVTHTIPPREHMALSAITLPQILKNAGYVTAHIGKWHLGSGKGFNPLDRGFDHGVSIVSAETSFFNPEVVVDGKRERRTGFREDILTDETIRFIETNKEKPFFCYFALFSPHEPLGAPEEEIAKYRGKPGVDEKMATYLAMVANVDKNVGRVLDRLKELKLDERTIVVFMNDNGATCGLDLYNAGMRGCKSTAWPGGTRAISFWRWTGHWKPQDVDTLASVEDVFPTLAALAGATIPPETQAKLDGYSLAPLLDGGTVPWADERTVFVHLGRWPGGTAAEHKYTMAGVRWKEYLLESARPCNNPGRDTVQAPCLVLRSVEKGVKRAPYTKENAAYHWGVTPESGWALYDVRKDPGCEKNLAGEQEEVVKKLSVAYDTWWDEVLPQLIANGGDAPHMLEKPDAKQPK